MLWLSLKMFPSKSDENRASDLHCDGKTPRLMLWAIVDRFTLFIYKINYSIVYTTQVRFRIVILLLIYVVCRLQFKLIGLLLLKYPRGEPVPDSLSDVTI